MHYVLLEYNTKIYFFVTGSDYGTLASLEFVM